MYTLGWRQDKDTRGNNYMEINTAVMNARTGNGIISEGNGQKLLSSELQSDNETNIMRFERYIYITMIPIIDYDKEEVKCIVYF